MHFTRFRTLAVAGLVLALAPRASAQVRPSEFDTWVIPGWTFTPAISLGGGWDSNVAVAANQAEGRRTDSDQLFTIEPQAQFDFRSARTEFVAGYRGAMRRYVTVDELNGFDQRGYISFRHLATRRVQVFARNEFDDVPSTDEIPLNGIPYARFGARTNRFGAGSDLRVTKRSDASVLIERTWVDFDNKETLLTGGVMNALRLAYTVRRSERLRVGAEYRVRHFNVNDNTRELWFHDSGGLLEQTLSRRVKLSLAGGYTAVRERRAGDALGGVYVRAGLERTAERSTAGVAYERSYAPSFGDGGANISQEARVFVYMPFSRNHFYVNGTGLWRRTDPLLLGDLELDSVVVESTVGYVVARWLRLEAFHAFSRQDSKITGGEVNRHRAGAQLVISQPMRIQ